MTMKVSPHREDFANLELFIYTWLQKACLNGDFTIWIPTTNSILLYDVKRHRRN